MSRLQLATPYIQPLAWFHAYILCGVIGIRWGKHCPTYANSNTKLNDILHEYLIYACGDDGWEQRQILDAIRFKSKTTIKSDARRVFPSLFPRNRKARCLAVPKELNDVEKVSFDPKRIAIWRLKVKAIKKEIMMNENAVAQDATNVAQPVVDNSVNSNNSERVTVNFIIPEGVSPESLTFENYREQTGKRFRMTKDQFKVRGMSREAAFEESKALAFSQLGGIGGA